MAFGYSRDAEQECAAFHDSTELAEVKRTGRIIKLLTVFASGESAFGGQEILDEEHAQKM